MSSPHNYNPYGSDSTGQTGSFKQPVPGGGDNHQSRNSQNKASKKPLMLTIAGAVLVLMIVAGLTGGNDDGDNEAASSATLSAPATATATALREQAMEESNSIDPSPTIPSSEPAVSTTAPMLSDVQAQASSLGAGAEASNNGLNQESAQSGSVTREQRNAVQSAKSYLSYSAFSDKGLREQLAFEGYPQDAIDYAMNNVNVDWNEQAVKMARQYDQHMGMSDAGLYDQLIFEGFTPEQAQYGVDNI